ncbi:hypothetical protein EMIHUDRAFT_454234, partial [Emiliania huxleyi CCMP1516]|uniref:Uncharacterized protein n=2 Tax=Emiliania huxleyi TaxID=2903 RepID=A0A0D3IY88_EMIH1
DQAAARHLPRHGVGPQGGRRPRCAPARRQAVLDVDRPPAARRRHGRPRRVAQGGFGLLRLVRRRLPARPRDDHHPELCRHARQVPLLLRTQHWAVHPVHGVSAQLQDGRCGSCARAGRVHGHLRCRRPGVCRAQAGDHAGAQGRPAHGSVYRDRAACALSPVILSHVCTTLW